MAVGALDFFVWEAIDESHVPADGFDSQSVVLCSMRQKVTRNYELRECLGNNLINHTHMQNSDPFVKLAHEYWDTDHVLFARGLLPRDWLPVSELAECAESSSQ